MKFRPAHDIFVYIRQLEFAILQLQMQLKTTLSWLDSTVEGQIAVNAIPPTLLLTLLRSTLAQLTVGYTVFTGMELNGIYLSC